MSREHDAGKRKARTLPTPGKIQPGKLGIYKGPHLVAQCGPKATAVTARRFGVVDAKFKNGAWRGH
jgi:hypothetical protein